MAINNCEIFYLKTLYFSNNLKYVASRDQKEFMKDLKLVYQATTKDIAEEELLRLGDKWGKKYPLVINLGIISGIIYQFTSSIHQI